MDHIEHDDVVHISRRRLITGAGLAGGAAFLGSAALPGTAAAATAAGRGSPHPNLAARPHTPPPGLIPISSPPQAGVTYRFAMWDDFLPQSNLANGRRFIGSGVYSNTTSDYLAATFDLPPGVLVYDMEYYLVNVAQATVYGLVWSSGSGPVTAIVLSQTTPANGSLHAARFVIDAAVNGPYPHGTKFVAAVQTPIDGTVQINGVRVGFVNGPLQPVVLAPPRRAYDSQNNAGPLVGGNHRKVTLTASLPVGAVAALLRVTAYDTTGSGSLIVYPDGGTGPAAATAVHWSGAGQIVAAETTTQVSAGLAVQVAAAAGTGTAQCTLDVVGYYV